ncbi:MAG: SDR family NAD(P)-dependent oxidoreductase [Planctomycetes bacterium]|nr:SDR family NAD(P)-dependent oxidoreductase [Planctomycetota bacterium]
MNSIIVGASAGIGRSLAEQLASLGHNLILVSSDQRDIDCLAKDLSIRFNSKVELFSLDLNNKNTEDLVTYGLSVLNKIDNLFLIAGWISNEDYIGTSKEIINYTLDVNLRSMIFLINSFYPHFEKTGGNIVGIGSVASIRGRKNNCIYSTAKRALEFYFECLRHSKTNSHFFVQFYRLGYVQTQMSFGSKMLIPTVTTNYISNKIIAGLEKDLSCHYLPFWWRFVGTVLRKLPWFFYSKLNF